MSDSVSAEEIDATLRQHLSDVELKAPKAEIQVRQHVMR